MNIRFNYDYELYRNSIPSHWYFTRMPRVGLISLSFTTRLGLIRYSPEMQLGTTWSATIVDSASLHIWPRLGDIALRVYYEAYSAWWRATVWWSICSVRAWDTGSTLPVNARKVFISVFQCLPVFCIWLSGITAIFTPSIAVVSTESDH